MGRLRLGLGFQRRSAARASTTLDVFRSSDHFALPPTQPQGTRAAPLGWSSVVENSPNGLRLPASFSSFNFLPNDVVFTDIFHFENLGLGRKGLSISGDDMPEITLAQANLISFFTPLFEITRWNGVRVLGSTNIVLEYSRDFTSLVAVGDTVRQWLGYPRSKSQLLAAMQSSPHHTDDSSLVNLGDGETLKRDTYTFNADEVCIGLRSADD